VVVSRVMLESVVRGSGDTAARWQPTPFAAKAKTSPNAAER
jgi:hypothetical protein